MLALRASGPVGAFLCARDDASVLPLLLVHFNIVMYAMGYWITQPVLPFLSKKLGADAVVFGEEPAIQTYTSSPDLVEQIDRLALFPDYLFAKELEAPR